MASSATLLSCRFCLVMGDVNEDSLCVSWGARQYLDSAMMNRALRQPQASLAPDDARKFLDEMLLSRPLRGMIRGERLGQPVFAKRSRLAELTCGSLPMALGPIIGAAKSSALQGQRALGRAHSRL
jgi:hypothetical protein